MTIKPRATPNARDDDVFDIPLPASTIVPVLSSCPGDATGLNVREIETIPLFLIPINSRQISQRNPRERFRVSAKNSSSWVSGPDHARLSQPRSPWHDPCST